MKSSQLDKLFAALAHPARRRILDLLCQAPGLSVKALAAQFAISRIAVMKHLRALEACELVLSKREGRTRRLFFNSVPIQLVHERWTDQYSAYWGMQLVDLKKRVESRSEAKDHQSA